MPGHHQDADTHQILYIYIYETVQLEPPPPSTFFSKINEIFISINLCRGTIKMLNTHQILYIYIYETVQLEPPPPSTFFPKSMKYLYLSTYAGAPSRC